EGFKPASEPTCAFGRVTSIEEVHAEVVPGRAVAQHEPCRHKHRGGHRERRLVLSSPSGQPVVLGSQVARTRPRTRAGRLHQGGLEPRVAVTDPSVERLTGTLLVTGAEPRPGDQVS